MEDRLTLFRYHFSPIQSFGFSPPATHHIYNLALPLSCVLFCAELNVVCHAELLTHLQDQLGSMPAWRQ